MPQILAGVSGDDGRTNVHDVCDGRNATAAKVRRPFSESFAGPAGYGSFLPLRKSWLRMNRGDLVRKGRKLPLAGVIYSFLGYKIILRAILRQLIKVRKKR